ncbi:MAG: hypothetical protein HYY28_11745 [Betaproteobacteria bacterium]|nr:hypothetical protein [Betaproteobacteria bacterium]MBI2960979.1 hypothetical protein [Betaproteobacteria bacterium]
MLIRVGKIALYLLLALMPLQSVASSAQPLFCDSETQQRLSATASHHHDGGLHSHHGMEGENGAATHDGCQHNVPCAVSASNPVAEFAAPVYDTDGPEYFFSHFPEQLKRPPLALAA